MKIYIRLIKVHLSTQFVLTAGNNAFNKKEACR